MRPEDAMKIAGLPSDCVDCDLTMKPDTIIEKVAITTTFYDCPKCKSRIGIVTLNPLNANQQTK